MKNGLLVALACPPFALGLAACALDFDRFDPVADASASSPRDALDEAPEGDAAADAAAPGDAGADALGRSDARFSDAAQDAAACVASPGCLTTATACAATCAQQQQTCSTRCMNSACRSGCTRTESTCTAACATSCTDCTQSAAGCRATAACADAAR